MPAGQGSHAPAPALVPKKPAPHARHWEEPTGEKYPAAQVTHAEKDMAPSAPFAVPAGHAVQLMLPNEDVKNPGRQAEHAAELIAPKVELALPGGQERHVRDELAPTDALHVPIPHAKHTDELEAPIVVEKVPGGHGVGIALPSGQK